MAEAAHSKRDLRAGARAARAALSPQARESASAEIARLVLDLPEAAAARAVLAYAAMPEEVDPAGIVAALRARGARIALPRVCGPGALALHWVEDDEELPPGHAGIAEPAESCAWAAPDEFDLVLVPGVAFDAGCARLGFGGGFYDALLPSLSPGAVTIGLAYDEQMVDEVPREPHDEHVLIVVTPSAVHRRG